MTTLKYICIPNLEGTFDSQSMCERNIQNTLLLASQDGINDISKRLQTHIYYQNGQDKIHSITWDIAKSEISNGRKTSHWIWYVFPVFYPIREKNQISKLILEDLEEVRAYIKVDILRNRLIKITQIAQIQLSKGIPAKTLFGDANDASKFWECITVFFLASINWKLPVPSKQEVEKLNKVCGAALRALHPHATGQDMLHKAIVNEVIRQDSTIHESLTKDTYHQKYIKYK